MNIENETTLSRFFKFFITSPLTPMLIVISLCFGAAALVFTPKEEEPQIVVPMADIYISALGATPEEIKMLATYPLEQILWGIDGVEYIYSMTKDEAAIVTVRFFVGENREDSLLKLHNKIQMNLDRVPSIVDKWMIKPIEIDDVPIVNITLYSNKYSDYELRRTAEEIQARISGLDNISRSYIVGGRKREIRVDIDPQKMDGFGVDINDITKALKGADASVRADQFTRNNTVIFVSANTFLSLPKELEDLAVFADKSGVVYLKDVANISDGAEEAKSYASIFFTESNSDVDKNLKGKNLSSVTLAFAKKKGSNAVVVSEDILKEIDRIKNEYLPSDIFVEVTRDYGETTQVKVNSLLSSLLFAIISVVILLSISLGRREALVVALAVPISFSLALFVNMLLGYTINRVTLFALILSLGLVVDDPITNVENIQRHMKQYVGDPIKATINGLREVFSPVIMSTLAIIVCFSPLAFITGMMGPYMAPMALNVPITVVFSTFCALTIVPWITFRVLRNSNVAKDIDSTPSTNSEGRLYKYYGFILKPFLDKSRYRKILFIGICVLLLASCSLALFRFVPLKLLPFDNKNEFQVILDMPEGTTLEKTQRVVLELQDYLSSFDDVHSIVNYIGIASPMDFNSMVRHYYIRSGGSTADIQVILADRDDRDMQSHSLLLTMRNGLEKIAHKYDADMQLVEVPPGPPVLSTLVVEVYGDDNTGYKDLVVAANKIAGLMRQEEAVTDVIVMEDQNPNEINITIDKQKAALHGIDSQYILQTIAAAMKGTIPASLHINGERSPLMIRVGLSEKDKATALNLQNIPIRSNSGDIIPLGEFISIEYGVGARSIYRKNMRDVVYVTAEMAGRAPAEAVIDLKSKLDSISLPPNIEVKWNGEGEWKITLDVFRDMGLAYVVALLGIYIILTVNTGSFFMPLLIMLAIPLTVLGILPGFFILNLFTGMPGGYVDPIFFTATSMIGMIALGGIVIRNSLVLIEFVQDALKDGVELKSAILRSGAVRMRPILLTALTTAIGAFPIIYDPVFSGLAWALIFGLLASTLFTLIVIPVAYYSIMSRKM